MLASDIYTAKLCVIIVDEAHVIKQSNSGKEFSTFSMKITDLYFLFYLFFFSNKKYLRILNFLNVPLCGMRKVIMFT